MALKVDVNALKERLKKQKEEAENRANNKSKDGYKKSPFLKSNVEGKINVRATLYPHNDNPEVEPFVERAFHYGIPGNNVVYCPQENEGNECHLCDFVWGQMKENKGNTEVVKSWAQHLPKFSLFLPVLVRGREDEGPKLFKVGNQKNEPSEKVAQFYEWCLNEDTDTWMDPEEGFDIIVEFEKNGKFGICPKQGKLELARKSTPFGKKGEYEKFLKKVKNVDTDLPNYEKRDSDDTFKVLEAWAKKLGETVTPDNSSEMDSGSDNDSDDSNDESPKETKTKHLRDKLKDLGV